MLQRIRYRCFLALAALALPAAAQLTTADLEGTVRDADGTPRAGVALRAVHPATAFERSTVTDAQGRYRLRALPPGPWELRATLDAAGHARRDVVLEVGQVLTVNLELQPGVDDEILVTSTPLVERTASDLGTRLGEQEIADLPVLGRHVLDPALVAPGVTAFRSSTAPPFSPLQFGAQNSRAAVLLVDGIPLANDITGGPIGTNDGVLPQGAVAHMEVLTQRPKAEHGLSAAGIVNVVTRRGSNAWQGGVFGLFRDEGMNARNALDQAEEKAPYERRQFGLDLGGPLARDRTFAFLSAERSRRDNFAIVSTGGVFPELEGTFPQQQRGVRALLKVDHLAAAQRWWTVEGFTVDSEDDAVFGGRVASDGGVHFFEDVQVLTAAYQRVLSPRLLHEARIGYVTLDWDVFPTDDGPRRVFPSVETGRWPGGEQHLNVERWELREDVYLLAGGGDAREHDLKLGLSATAVRTRESFASLDTGLFVFLGDDVTAAPFLAVLGRGDGDFGTMDNERFGLYVQDDWKLRPRWTLNAGLRYDVETNATNQDYRSTKTDPDLPFIVQADRARDDDNAALRLGFAWDATGDGRTVVRGGWGLFYGRLISDLPFGEVRSDQYRFYTVLFPGTTDAGAIDVGGLPYRLDLLLPEKMEFPYSTQFSLGVSRQFGKHLALDVDIVGSRGKHETFGRFDVNAPDPATGLRPLPQYLEVFMARNDGGSSYDALRVVLRRQSSQRQGAFLRASYTWAKAENDFDDPFFSGFGFGRGPAAWDERHRLVVNGRFDLPWKLSLSALVSLASARPYTVSTGADDNRNGDLTDDQPDGVGRNSERADEYAGVDLRLVRLFRSGRADVEVFVEVFNALDTVNYEASSYVGNQSSPAFGQPTVALAPRQGQVGLRLRF